MLEVKKRWAISIWHASKLGPIYSLSTACIELFFLFLFCYLFIIWFHYMQWPWLSIANLISSHVISFLLELLAVQYLSFSFPSLLKKGISRPVNTQQKISILFLCFDVMQVDLLRNKFGFDEAFNYKEETDLDGALKRSVSINIS